MKVAGGESREVGTELSAGRETLVLLATQVWSLCAGLIAQAVLAWTLAPSGRGAFAICSTFATLVGLVCTPGTDAASQYAVMAGRHSPAAGTSVALLHAGFSSLLGVVVGLGLIASSLPYMQQAEDREFLVSLALMAANLFATTLELQLAGRRRFGQVGLGAIVRSTSYVALLGLLVVGRTGGVEAALWAFSGSLFLTALYYLGALRREGIAWPASMQRAVLETSRYGLRFYVARVGNAIDVAAGTLLLGQLGTAHDVGLFAAVSGLMLRLLVGADSLAAMLAPRVAARDHGVATLVALCSRVAVSSTALATLLLAWASDVVIRVLFSERFLEAQPAVWILTPGIVSYACATILMAHFRAIGRPTLCSHSVWWGLCLNVSVCLALYPRVGFVAAAWGMTAGFVLRATILAAAFVLSPDAPRNLVLLNRSDLKLLLNPRRWLTRPSSPANNDVRHSGHD